ncbi:uncharacterized protein LOC128994453 [Macrosteles quadrilineatus]|uniref:uncharacterized protein LOC128994453 n=1 Tax=Macrosteles quadrilineatus TaxID=74068 RepID=UPI0023E24B7B|nr:uncharacterized protein LOC128994453 [Macrosteles quadrilineatus]
MLIRKVLSKWKGTKWVTEDGYIFKFKRKLIKKYENSVSMLCQVKHCSAVCYVQFEVPWECNPECGKIIALKKNHAPGFMCQEKNFYAIQKLRRNILVRAERENTELSVIFQEETNKAPDEVRDKLKFSQLERTMQRVRAHISANLGTPNTMAEFAQLLDLWKDKYGTVNHEKFCLGLQGTGNEECIIAAVSPIINHPSFDKTAPWHLHGTFDCLPKSPRMSQLFVIMSSQFGRSVPIIWATMTTCTTKAYNVLFKAVKEHFPGIKPSVILGDYEKAMRSSLKRIFPSSKQVGSWFHFIQAIERKAKLLGIPYDGPGEGKTIAKWLMATALLPHDQVEEAVAQLEDKSLSLNDPAKASLLIEYFKKEWIQKVTSKSFSVYGQTERTNDCYESLMMRINKTIKPQGNACDFWDGLRSISVKEIMLFNRLQRGPPSAVRKLRNKWLLRDRSIKSKQERFIRGEITIENFVAETNFFIVLSGDTITDPDFYEHVDKEMVPLDVFDDTDNPQLDPNEDNVPTRYDLSNDPGCFIEPVAIEEEVMQEDYENTINSDNYENTNSSDNYENTNNSMYSPGLGEEDENADADSELLQIKDEIFDETRTFSSMGIEPSLSYQTEEVESPSENATGPSASTNDDTMTDLGEDSSVQVVKSLVEETLGASAPMLKIISASTAPATEIFQDLSGQSPNKTSCFVSACDIFDGIYVSLKTVPNEHREAAKVKMVQLVKYLSTGNVDPSTVKFSSVT